MKNNFYKSTHLKKTSNGQHKIAISDLWNVGTIPNGGYLMACAAKAMVESSSHPHPLSLTAYFLDKTDVGDAIISSKLLKKAKSISTLTASILQEKDPTEEGDDQFERVRLTGAFTDFSYLKGESYNEKTAPSIARFEVCKPVDDLFPPLRMYEQFNMRFDPATPGCLNANKNNPLESNLWLEFKDGSPFDVFSLIMAADVMPPAVFNRFGAAGWVPTIEMTVNIRAIPQVSRLQIRLRTNYVSSGILEEDVEIWDEQGNLLAISRQIAKLRMPKS